MYVTCRTASSGTVTINADSTVQILAEEAFPLDMLDAQVTCTSHDHHMCEYPATPPPYRQLDKAWTNASSRGRLLLVTSSELRLILA